MNKVLTLSLILFVTFFSHGQSGWVSDYNAAQESYSNDDLGRAQELAKASLESYLKESGEVNSNYRSILRLLSTISYELSEFEKGVEYATKELTVLEQMAAPKDQVYAGTLYNLGIMNQQIGELEKSERYLNEAIDIYKIQLSPADEELINSKWKLASVKYGLDKNEEAQTLFREAFEAFGNPEMVTMDYLEACYYYGILLIDNRDFETGVSYLESVKQIYEDSGYETSEEYLNVISIMADSFRQLDKNRAEELYKVAFALYEEGIGDLKSDSYTSLVNNRAVNLQQLGRSGEAEELLAGLNGGTSSGENTDISSLNNLAALSQQKGDLEAAEKYYNEALSLVQDKQSPSYAEVLENLALLYANTGRVDQAKANLNQSAEIILTLNGGQSERYASTLRKQGQIERQLNNHEQSEEYYKEALRVASSVNPGSMLSLQCANGLAVLYKEIGRYQEADSIYEKTVEQAKDLENSQLGFYALLLNNQATLKEIKGEHLEARNLLNASLRVNEQINNKSSNTYIGALENLSAIYIELGQYNQAKEVLTEAQPLIESKFGRTSSQYAANLLNFGRLEQATGNYPKAEPYFKQAMEMLKKTYGDMHPEYARSLNAMALFYQILGNNAEAEPLFLQSKNIYEKVYGKAHPEYVTTIENLSSLYQMKGENEKALPLLEEALQMDEQIYGTEHPIYATTLHNLASLFQRTDRLAEAEPLFEKALEIDQNVYGSQHRSYANTLYNLATLYQDMENFSKAEPAYIGALEIRKKILGENHPDYAYSLYGLASLYHGTQRLQEAHKYYVQVIEKYQQQIEEFFPSMSEKEKSAFYSKIKPVFDAFFDFCIEYHYGNHNKPGQYPLAEMYDLQLSTKALLLNASNKVRDRILQSGDPVLVKNYHDWISMKEQLIKYFNYSQEELAQHNIDLDKLKNEANELEKLLSEKSASFANEFEKERVSWIDVQRSLGENEAAIEIIRVTKKYVPDSILYAALVVTKSTQNEPALVILKNGEQLENRLFNYYRNSIKFALDNELSYNNFWSAIAEEMGKVDRVYLSSDGIYNKINIVTLWDPTTRKSVIDELEVRLLSNTRELVTKNDNSYSSKVAEVFGFPDFNLGLAAVNTSESSQRTTQYGFKEGISPLPGTKTEVENISKILSENNWQGNVLTDKQAIESNLKSIDQPRVLHIATHGFFMNDVTFDDRAQSFEVNQNDLNSNPLLRSGILLTGSAKTIASNQHSFGDDGVVTAYEAMNLNLDNTELVVLSACETGLGEVRNGEGVYGLQRSFIVAGAQNVIMSLWKVDDNTTQQLMSGFYSRWLSGMDKFQSFYEAQLEIKEEHSDPYHWGAFILLGK